MTKTCEIPILRVKYVGRVRMICNYVYSPFKIKIKGYYQRATKQEYLRINYLQKIQRPYPAQLIVASFEAYF